MKEGKQITIADFWEMGQNFICRYFENGNIDARNVYFFPLNLIKIVTLPYRSLPIKPSIFWTHHIYKNIIKNEVVSMRHQEMCLWKPFRVILY